MCTVLALSALQMLLSQSLLSWLDLSGNPLLHPPVTVSATGVGVLGGALRGLQALRYLRMERLGSGVRGPQTLLCF
jgi:hypothetical protein